MILILFPLKGVHYLKRKKSPWLIFCHFKKSIAIHSLLFLLFRVNISERIDLKNIIQLKEAFDAADEDGSGKLDMDEVAEN